MMITLVLLCLLIEMLQKVLAILDIKAKKKKEKPTLCLPFRQWRGINSTVCLLKLLFFSSVVKIGKKIAIWRLQHYLELASQIIFLLF